MLHPDRWAKECPFADDCTREELLDFLRNAPHAYLDEWDMDFCKSLERQLQRGQKLSYNQANLLDRGLLMRLWTSDPALWK